MQRSEAQARRMSTASSSIDEQEQEMHGDVWSRLRPMLEKSVFGLLPPLKSASVQGQRPPLAEAQIMGPRQSPVLGQRPPGESRGLGLVRLKQS